MRDEELQKLNRTSAAKAVKSLPLPLESVHHVHGSDGLAVGVLNVNHSVPDTLLQKDLNKGMDSLEYYFDPLLLP